MLFLLDLQNLVYILQLQYIAMWTRHNSSTQQPHVASGDHVGQCSFRYSSTWPFGNNLLWPCSYHSSHSFSGPHFCSLFQPLICCWSLGFHLWPFSFFTLHPLPDSYIPLLAMIPGVVCLSPTSQLNLQLEWPTCRCPAFDMPKLNSPSSLKNLLLSQAVVPLSTQTPKQKTVVPPELLFLLHPLELINCSILEVYVICISLTAPVSPSLQPLL